MEMEMTLLKKIALVQSELKAPKGQFNKFGNYKYRSCEDIVESLKPILTKYELVLNLNDELVLIGERYYIKATALLTDGEEVIQATSYAREPLELKGMTESQITGTASSYARKYALNGLLAIDDTKDPDTEEFTKTTQQEQPSQETQKATPKQIELLMKYYQDENLTRLLQSNNVSKLEELSMKKASELLSKILNKGANNGTN